MSLDNPTVSVSLVTYNHEKYVGEAIRSVLAQTVADLEVVVVDDGSTDGTPAVVRSFDDPRVVSIRQENGGPSAAINRALTTCRGRFVALMSGDDRSHPDRLERQLAEYARGGERLLFASVDLIGEDGRPCPPDHFAQGYFDLEPLTRAQVLERLFVRGNFLNAVTAFTEARLLRDLGPFDPVLYQAQDYEMWVRAVKRFDFGLMPDRLAEYRFRDNHGNLSAVTPESQTRLGHELNFIMRRFFDGVPADLFREAFRARLIDPECPTPEAVACEQAFLLLNAPEPMTQLIGLEELYALLGDPPAAAVLAGRHGFTDKQFVERLRHADLFGRYPRGVTTLFADTGHGFRRQDRVCREVWHGGGDFHLTFDLSNFAEVRGLRWDPVELQFCTLHLDAVTFRCGDEARPVDLAAARSNGAELGPGAFRFDTLDPIVYLPGIEGPAASVTLRGRWEVLPPFASLEKVSGVLGGLERQVRERDQAVAQRDLALAERGRELAAVREQLRSIVESRGYRMLEKARRVTRRFRRAG
jgi:glycosyltransferase involved in cell wall biosynthesis